MKLTILVLLALLAACSSEKSDEATTASPFAEMHKPIDRAEDVERQIMEQKERMDAALDAAERDVEPERG